MGEVYDVTSSAYPYSSENLAIVVMAAAIIGVFAIGIGFKRLAKREPTTPRGTG